MFTKAVTVSVLAMATMQASAMCLVTKPVALESAYDYYVALAQSLQMTKEARDGAAAALQKGASDQQSAANLLTVLKTAQADYACARQYVQGYQKSQDQGIQVSAAGVSVALTSLQWLVHSVEERITDILDGKGANETDGARAERTANSNMQFNDAWQTLMLGVTAASQSAPHFTNDRLDGMNLSAREREDVIRRFKALGPGIEHENPDSPPLETSVAILLQYLQDRRLKSFGHG